MRKENPGQKLEKYHHFLVVVEEGNPTKMKKEIEEKEKLSRE